MIAQEVAIRYPDRVRTLTSIMSSTGNPELPPSSPDVVGLLITPAPTDRESYLEQSLQTWRVLNGPAFSLDEERTRELAAEAFDRGLNPAGTMRQLAAIIGSGSRREALAAVRLPTLVIHGDADPLVPVEGGIDTAEAIPGAELLIIEGMGHNIPPAVAPRVIEAIVRHAAKG
jgi:pimeloyl-ACP methyl ester carboxylesterase